MGHESFAWAMLKEFVDCRFHSAIFLFGALGPGGKPEELYDVDVKPGWVKCDPDETGGPCLMNGGPTGKFELWVEVPDTNPLVAV